MRTSMYSKREKITGKDQKKKRGKVVTPYMKLWADERNLQAQMSEHIFNQLMHFGQWLNLAKVNRLDIPSRQVVIVSVQQA